MKSPLKKALFFLSGPAGLAFFGFFYYTYVPLIKPFQWALAPLLVLIFLLTAFRRDWGILFFVFAFPLVNNLPYFFGITPQIPHAPTSLVLFLAFFFGWLLSRRAQTPSDSVTRAIFRPVYVLSAVVAVSAAITFWRYTNFFPVAADRVLEIVVNVNALRAGGARMSCLFNALSYLTALAFFIVLMKSLRSSRSALRILFALSLSTLITVLFAFVQKTAGPGLGNTAPWIDLNQINSTFKDPNSLGTFLSAAIPLFIGLAFYLQGRRRIFFILLSGLCFIALPASGSRSAFLAVLVSIAALLAMAAFHPAVRSKRKTVWLASGFLILALTAAAMVFLFPQSSLSQRLRWSVRSFSRGEPANAYLTQKAFFWTIAGHMVRDYPLTGVGMGSYIVQQPDYFKQMARQWTYTDSAENYLFQAASETGILGLLLVLWIFWEITRRFRRAWRESLRSPRPAYLVIGAASALMSLLVNYQFHSYIGNFEVKYLFWILVWLLFVPWAPPETEREVPFLPGRSFKIASLLLIGAFGAAHLWNSTHSLAVNNRAARFDWEQDYGFYEIEKDNREFYFRWARKSAGLAVDNWGATLVIPMLASHPDIRENPVTVRVFLADAYFRKTSVIGERLLNESRWQDFEFRVPEAAGEKIFLVFETDRSWQPSKITGIPDPRHLAIGLGEPWFKYPAKIDSEGTVSLDKAVFSEWEGDFKTNLIGFGSSRLGFESPAECAVLRLWVKGQEALGVSPLIIIRLDDRVIAKTMLTGGDWQSLVLAPEMGKGAHVLTVEFKNDFYDSASGEDRNVF
ncbi:MAG: O-antigen ligase family protein, partial [Candidatus Aminicenantes bacterium]|nr:O-antigen ligase family protein [Candidatus Aminicenantes bacterium]